MSHSAWEANNNRYLSDALKWLRLVLLRHTQSANVSSPPPSPEMQIRRRFSVWRRSTPLLPSTILISPNTVPEGDIDAARRAMDASAALVPAPALIEMADIFDLSAFEKNVLLLCAAAEIDPRMTSPQPTFALAFSIFDTPSWDSLSPERPLRAWRMIEINQPAGQPLTSSPLRIDERILNAIKGLHYLDDRISPLVTPLLPEQGVVAASHAQIGREIVLWLTARPSNHIVHLIGTDSASKQAVAARAASDIGLRLYRLPAALLPTSLAEIETFIRLWQREAALLPIALYIDTSELTERPSAMLSHLIQRMRGLLFLNTREVWPDAAAQALVIDVSKPTPIEQRAAWADALGDGQEDAARLSSQFNLNLAAIHQIAREVETQSPPDKALALWRACAAYTRPRLDMLAQRINAKATWDDIVLPEQATALLRLVVQQVRQRATVYDDWGYSRRMNRGLGISVLCAGESGTGKTMAAEVIANDLKLDLYRIDLSAVVSKYIGETEKNLRVLFDAAEDGGAVLFFDEADALFGKRSEVKDSHDRYANIEINYLLQRIESYRGLALLATNLKNTLDTAFIRRLRFIIQFPYPGPTERRLMWQKVFPPETPTAPLDFDYLARLNLAGGNIHSIALNAAFLAAAAPSPVTMALILQAARVEFQKLERPFNESDLHWKEDAV